MLFPFSLTAFHVTDISEVAKYANPPQAVKLVLEGLCIMFQIAPMKVGEAGRKVDDYWYTCEIFDISLA